MFWSQTRCITTLPSSGLRRVFLPLHTLKDTFNSTLSSITIIADNTLTTNMYILSRIKVFYLTSYFDISHLEKVEKIVRDFGNTLQPDFSSVNILLHLFYHSLYTWMIFFSECLNCQHNALWPSILQSAFSFQRKYICIHINYTITHYTTIIQLEY